MMQPREYQEILHWLAESQGMTPQGIRQAVRSALEMGGIDESWSWYERLQLMVEPLQMRAVRLQQSVASLRQGDPMFPVLTCVTSGDKARWVGIWGRKRGKYKVTEIVPSSVDRWMSEAELRKCLGVVAGDVLDWITVECLTPLSSWQDEVSSTPTDVYNFKSAWPRLRGMLASERGALWTIAIYAMIIGVMTLVTPIAVQALVNTVAFGALLQPLVVLSIMLALGLIFVAVMQAIQAYLVEMVSRRMFIRVLSDFAFRFTRAADEALDKHDRAELANYFFDVLTIQKVLAVLLLQGTAALLSIISGMLLLGVYHPVLLAFDVFLIISVGLLVYVMGRGAIATSIQESKKKHKIAAWLDQLSSQSTLYKSAGGIELATSQADQMAREYLHARQKHFRIVMRQLIFGLGIQVFASAGLLLVGGWLVISSQLTLGQLVASELIVSVLVASLIKLVRSFEKFYDLLASLDKIGKVIDLPLERTDGAPLPLAHEPVSLQLIDVSHKTNAGHPMFSRLNASLKPGERLAIVGLEGVGRSALAGLLFGLYRPQAGQIHINQSLIQDLKLHDLRRVVGLARETHLLHGSLLENIQLDRMEVSRKDARRALYVTGLLDYVLTLPNGLHSSLKEACLTPQQEKQLILARVLAGRPGLLVIDGLLDQCSEPMLLEILRRLNEEGGPTTLILTNRVEAIGQCHYQLHVTPASLPQTDEGLAEDHDASHGHEEDA